MSKLIAIELRREELARKIALQRGQLATAYRDLAKPITYVETGLKGLGFLRRNQWIFVAGPSLLSMTSMLVSWSGIFGRKKPPAPVRTAEREVKVAPKKGLGRVLQTARTGVGYAAQLYRLYQQIRPYL